MRRAVLAGVVLLALIGPPAEACSWSPRATSASLEDADVAFIGRATVVEHHGNERIASLSVLEVYKGSLPPLVEVRTALSPLDCGVIFVPGEVYSVFASLSGDRLETELPFGTATGGASLAEAGVSPTAIIVDGSLEALGRAGAARAGPIAAAAIVIVLTAASLAARIGWPSRRAPRLR